MAPPRQDLAGQSVLNDWYGQINNRLTIVNIIDQLLPVQDMLAFQRRIRDREIKLDLTVGQLGLFQAIVPDSETWKILWAGLTHGDSAPKTTTLEITPRDLNRNGIVITRRGVDPGLDTPLYPSASEHAVFNDIFRALTGPAYEAFPGDRIRILDETITAAAGPISWVPYIRYEVLPPPVRAETDTLFIAQAV